MEYLIKQYPVDTGALEIQYIEEFFGEFPRRKTAADVMARLHNRESLILMAEAPLPDSICMTGFAGLTLMTYYRYSNVFGAKGGRSAETEPLPLAPKPAIRIHFPDTALWIPDLVTDANGEARARLRMPDSITTMLSSEYAR